MAKILIATTSAGKAQELRERLQGSWDVETLLDAEKRLGERPLVKEIGKTFGENARIKAVGYSLWARGQWVLADDSGLCVESLGGEPGVFSADYAGEPRDDGRNLELVLERMRGVKDRGASFCCVLVLARDGEVVAEVEGRCCGRIGLEARGSGGFGYDPIFIPDGYDQSFGELPLGVKMHLSHRAKALDRIVEVFMELKRRGVMESGKEKR